MADTEISGGNDKPKVCTFSFKKRNKSQGLRRKKSSSSEAAHNKHLDFQINQGSITYVDTGENTPWFTRMPNDRSPLFRLMILWCIGFMVRYFVLLPFRLMVALIGISWLIVCTAFIGYLPDGSAKRALNRYVMLMCFRIFGRGCSAIINFHDEENRARNGICVANHTSPIDVIILSVDNCYAMIGQSHGGLLGIIQRAMARATAHIWFERSEVKDRYLVARRLKEHVEDKNKLPILIFPEGTCINNTSVMMFKKGSFEIGTTIYPVAIKYDPRFGDAFWNSSKQGMVSHLLNIMTSWALVCDVWYLPPMSKRENEDAVDFANRVKAEIAKKGGFVDLEWDGQLKRMSAKVSWREKQQENYSKMLKVE